MKQATASVVSIVEESIEGGLWMLKSSNLPGLVLHGPDLEIIRESVPKAIKGLFKLNYDLNVTAFPVVEPRNLSHHFDEVERVTATEWAVVPSEN